MPVHPYNRYKLATLLNEEDKKKRYNLILSSAAFIPLLRRKRVLALSLDLLDVLIPPLIAGALGLMIFFSLGDTTLVIPPSVTPQLPYPQVTSTPPHISVTSTPPHISVTSPSPSLRRSLPHQ